MEKFYKKKLTFHLSTVKNLISCQQLAVAVALEVFRDDNIESKKPFYMNWRARNYKYV